MSTAPKRIPNYGHSSRKKQLPAGDGTKTWARSPTTFTAFVTTVQLMVVKSEFCCNVAPTLVGQEMTAIDPASAGDRAMLNDGGFIAVQILAQFDPALLAAAASLTPLADTATDEEIVLVPTAGPVSSQVVPELVEVQIPSSRSDATSVTPSADEAMASQYLDQCVEDSGWYSVQVVPELVEV